MGLRSKPQPCGARNICEAQPRAPLGTFLPKSPRDPKKPNCIGFRLSSVDSEQGCRRQPCFMFGAHSAAPQPPRCPTRLPFVPHPLPVRTRRTHPAKALKLQPFVFFLQSISNSVVSLPNLSEKDVKGLLFRKQPLHTAPQLWSKSGRAVARFSPCNEGKPSSAPERKRRALFLSLENLSPFLDCACECKIKPTASSPRDSPNWL